MAWSEQTRGISWWVVPFVILTLFPLQTSPLFGQLDQRVEFGTRRDSVPNDTIVERKLDLFDPSLVRQQILDSGLSPEEVRGRLRGAGYREDLLDQYMDTDTTRIGDAPPLSPEAREAIQLLGLTPTDTSDLDTLPPLMPDSLREDVGDSDLFGLDIFRRVSTEFEPVVTGPVPSNYRLGPGDVLVLVITGDTELVHTLEVTREGYILIPQVGQVYVASLTMAQLREALYDRLGQVYSGIKRGEEATTRFDITVARVRMNQVYVVGEVARPGSYQVSAVGTVLNALYLAGGPTERGNFRRVEVRRRGEVVSTFDLYDYLLRGDTGNDIALEEGDLIFVPVHGTRASVRGAVIRPATYELKEGETLADLIEAAGGFTPEAALERISISRIAPPGKRKREAPSRIVVDIPLGGDDQKLKAAPFPIEPGDRVTVFALPGDRGGYVSLEGNVYLPGTFGWREGLRLSELIRLAGGLKPATYAGAAHIDRLDPRDQTRKIIEVRLPADSGAPMPDDILLQEYDIVTIYGREEFRAARTVTIAGMVNEPGTFEYREGMTLRDLVLMARGLRDGALLDSAEIARLPTDRSGGRIAERLKVPLDSTYLFEPGETSYRFLPGTEVASRESEEIPLEPFDHVLIFKQPEFTLHRMVEITGEVAYPGMYALTSREDRISDLIGRAGGLLPSAYAPGASLEREYEEIGPVDIDLEEILRRPRSRGNLRLFPGDVLHVPEYNPVIRVRGQVNSPTSVQYRPGAGIEYYISSAGGYTRDADKGNVSVRYPSGKTATRQRKLLFFRSSPTPLPGSTITVPTLSPEDKVNWTSVLGTAAQVAGSVSTIVILLTRIKN